MDPPLLRLLDADAVPMDELRRRYGPLLALVRALIGVVPNCDAYLEIWPTAFRSYNVMIPSFLNLPLSLWGAGAPKDVVGLAMYAASRAASCMYCSAHASAFALRRGARPEKVAGVLDDAVLTAPERAAVAAARSLSSSPASLTDAERRELARHFSPGAIEWIVLGVAMMGFLNKFMDAVGVRLEVATIEEVRALIGPSGWTMGKHFGGQTVREHGALPRPDGLRSALAVLPHVPPAVLLDRRWTSGVPDRWPAVGAYLHQRTGHDFPVLRRLQHRRAVRATAVMLRDNLDPASSVVGLEAKILAGLVYATIADDAWLAADVRVLARRRRISDDLVDRAAVFAGADGEGVDLAPLDARSRALLALARAASPSPASVSSAVVDACKASGARGAAVVELLAFLSVMQMLHRLATFYAD